METRNLPSGIEPPRRHSPAPERRKSGLFLMLQGLGLALFALSFLHAALQQRLAEDDIERRRQLAATLELTDLALFTEARYTRHPSQADLHSAFQDHPVALEHFPSGSLVPAARPGETSP